MSAVFWRWLVCGAAMWSVFPLAHAAKFVVDDTKDAVDAKLGDGVCAINPAVKDDKPTCTLRAAIQEANALIGADEITLPKGTYALSIAGTQEDMAATGDLDITDALTIQGAGSATTNINGMSKDRIFDIYPSSESYLSDAILSGVTLTGGLIAYDDSAGGAVLSDARLVLQEVVFDSNQVSGANGSGGALCSLDGRVELSNVKFINNKATHSGGAVFLRHTPATLVNVEVSNNESKSHGGGIFVGNYTNGPAASEWLELYVIHSTFRGNKIVGGVPSDPAVQGGAVYLTGGVQVVLENSEFIGNVVRSDCTDCAGDGGAIAVDDADVLLNRVYVADNTTTRFGGGLYVKNNADRFGPDDPYSKVVNVVSVAQSAFVGNRSIMGWGGAIVAMPAHDPKVTDSVQAKWEPSVHVAHSLLAKNSARSGGAIAGSVAVSSSTISGNQAAAVCGTDPGNSDPECGQGGAVIVPTEIDSVVLRSVTIAQNTATAPVSAAAIYIPARGGLFVEHSILSHAMGGVVCSGVATLSGYTLSSDTSCGLVGSSDIQSEDPLLLDLAPNGITPISVGVSAPQSSVSLDTHALADVSPARDVIPVAACASMDQRLATRSGGAACDAGAFEYDASAAQVGTIAFGATETTVTEDKDSAGINKKFIVSVDRLGGSQGVAQVYYRIRPLTAKLGEKADFNIATAYGSVQWADGNSDTQSILIDIIDDEEAEKDESFSVELFAPVYATMSGVPLTKVVTIVENDQPKVVTPPPPVIDKATAPVIEENSDGGSGAIGPLSVLALVCLTLYRRRYHQ